MKVVYEKSQGLTDTPLSYCPGCTHGVVHKLVAENIVEMGLLDKTIGVAPVGCTVLNYNFFNFDVVQAPHGRAPAVATGIKRAVPDKFVYTYQGDGDLAAIGTAETVHAAARGENISIVFVNNAIYGMTGGQMAPTTIPGQVTKTTPYGRDVNYSGYPIRICELLQSLEGVCYLERVSVDTVPNIKKAKKAIRKAFQNQLDKKGFSLVEIISTCPTNWGVTPVDALKWLQEKMLPYYPLGVYKDCSGEEN